MQRTTYDKKCAIMLLCNCDVEQLYVNFFESDIFKVLYDLFFDLRSI